MMQKKITTSLVLSSEGLRRYSRGGPEIEPQLVFASSPNLQNNRKSNAEECIFDYIASHIEGRFNKNSLL